MDQILLAHGMVPGKSSSQEKRRRHVCFVNNKQGHSHTAKRPGQKKRRTGGTNATHVPVSHVDVMPPLDIEEELLAELPMSSDPESSQWIQRQENEEDHWREKRAEAFESFLAAHSIPRSDRRHLCSCGGVASILCSDCPAAYMCELCDAAAHWSQPFHLRKEWSKGFLRPLPAGSTVSATSEECVFDTVLPLNAATPVCDCGSAKEMVASSARVITITAIGRFDLLLPDWSCSACNSRSPITDEDLLKCGYVRASPVLLRCVIQETVLHMWRALKLASPGTSLKAFLAMLEDAGARRASKERIDPERFAKAYQEWSNMTYELDRLVGIDRTTCEACGPSPMAVHVDGNFKLYRYRSAGRADASSAYHSGTIIDDRIAVDAHMRKVDSVAKPNNRCGMSTWTAARNSDHVPSKRSQDETGLSIATCRHSVVLGAVNMHRGERFGYASYLHQTRFRDVSFFATDVVCKYWPWSQRVAARLPEFATGDTRPYLSVMHATGHSYYCQITYGGFWQSESGWSVMETTELANAHLSRAGNTTKHMTGANRVDSLTDLVLSYNNRKHNNMSQLLVSKLTATRARIPELASDLQGLLAAMNITEDDIPPVVSELKALAAALGKRDLDTNGRGLENAIEIVCDSMRSRLAARDRMADTSKKRAKVWRQLQGDRRKLAKLLSQYRAATGVVLTPEDARDGNLPWHVAASEPGRLTLSEKRALCEAHMRLCRAREEVDIVTSEMATFLNASERSLLDLQSTLTVIQERDTLPDGMLSQSGPADRYRIEKVTSDVLSGLKAVVKRAISFRRHTLDTARICFDGQ